MNIMAIQNTDTGEPDDQRAVWCYAEELTGRIADLPID
jgi:hypothetical protein